MKTTVESTGEVLEFPDKSAEQVVESWRLINEYISAYEKLKDGLKKIVPKLVDDRGLFEHDGYQFRVSYVQRMNYDKATLRQVLQDEDLIDTFLQPAKPLIDRYIKEHLDELGEASTILRSNMVEVGRPYQVIKLEKLG